MSIGARACLPPIWLRSWRYGRAIPRRRCAVLLRRGKSSADPTPRTSGRHACISLRLLNGQSWPCGRPGATCWPRQTSRRRILASRSRFLRRSTPPWLSPEDRKCVVYGKSVSVRVDLGGRRIIQKKYPPKNYIAVYIDEETYTNIHTSTNT